MLNSTRLTHHWPALLALAPLAAGVLADPPKKVDEHLNKIEHIIVVYQENWSFDSLYGQFPGVDGLQNGFDNLPQFDTSGGAIYMTPQAKVGSPLASDTRFPPANGQPALPLIPYDLTKYVTAEQTTVVMVTGFYKEQLR